MVKVNLRFVHSIVLGNSDFEFEHDFDGCKICIYPNDFCLENNKHSDFLTKASYIYTYSLSNIKEEENISKRLKRVIKGEICKYVVLECIETDYFEKGNIDCYNKDVCKEVAFDDEKMRRFLFNEKSILIISIK